jgi:hypothetical protein
MTILERIKQDLSHLDEQQLQQVAEFIASVKRQSELLPTGRKNILQLLEVIRSRHPSRPAEAIDQDLQRERNTWDS